MPKQPKVPEVGEFLVTMDQAIKQLSTTRSTFHRWLRAGKIKGFKLGRQWRFRQQDISEFLDGGSPPIALSVSPQPLIDGLVTYAHLDIDDESTIESAAKRLMRAALKSGSSHFHADALADDEEVQGSTTGNRGVVRFRIDGLMQFVCDYDVRLHKSLIDEFKRLSSLDVTESKKLQTGRFSIPISSEKKVQISVSVVPSTLGECLTCRIMDPATARVSLNALGLAGNSLQNVQSKLTSNRGLVLASGPSDSGKLITAYSMLNYVNNKDLKLVSVEDQVEVGLPNVLQLQVDKSAGLSYPTVIQTALATNPDVMFIKRIRDEETLLEALDAALSKLVICSMHCTDSVAALITMRNWGARGLLLGDAINLLSSQRLVRRLCPDCKQSLALTDQDRGLIDRVCHAHGLDRLDGEFASTIGCAKCRGTGFLGRIGIYEALGMNPDIESAILIGLGYDDIRRTAIAGGMETLCLDGLRKAASGTTSIREFRRVTSDLLGQY
jgi:excisionase family DNA binding protein